MIPEAVAQDITYITDTFMWSWSTLIMCAVGQIVHWLSAYGRSFSASKKMGTPPPSVWLYWSGDWPSTVTALITVFAGYFMIPEIGRVWPTIGGALGVVAEDGTLVGLNMLSAFLWGAFGSMIADYAGKRLTRLVE
jgi:hypothetical protein